MLIQCIRCGQIKDEAAFDVDRARQNGRYPYCKTCCADRARQYYGTHKQRILDDSRESHRRLRDEVLTAYGGRCSCCGEAHKEFLTIHHCKGKGGEHMRALGTAGRGWYLALKRLGYPPGEYACLCYNCNSARSHVGYCPHELERQGSA